MLTMSKTQMSRAVAALVAIALAFLLDGSDIGSADAQAAAAPARPATAPGIVVANPPAGPAPVAAPPPAALAPAAPAAAAAAGAGAATPRVIVIDRNFILQRSSAGQDMMSQVQNLTKAAETQFRTEETQLATE